MTDVTTSTWLISALQTEIESPWTSERPERPPRSTLRIDGMFVRTLDLADEKDW